MARTFTGELVAACLALAMSVALAASGLAQTTERELQSAGLHQQQGISFLQKHDLQRALAELRSAVALNSWDPVSHDYLGVTLWESGQVEAAISEFERARHLDDKSALTHYHLALAYDQIGSEVLAVREYQHALYRQPGLVAARYGLSNVCQKMGDLDGSIQLLRAVVHADVGFAEAHYNLGVQLWQRYLDTFGLRHEEDMREAVQQLHTAVDIQPRQAAAYIALAKIQSENQDVEGAIETLKKALQEAPDDFECLYNYGLALRQNGDLGAAEAEFRGAIEGNPRYAPAHRLLGFVLRQKVS